MIRIFLRNILLYCSSASTTYDAALIKVWWEQFRYRWIVSVSRCNLCRVYLVVLESNLIYISHIISKIFDSSVWKSLECQLFIFPTINQYVTKIIRWQGINTNVIEITLYKQHSTTRLCSTFLCIEFAGSSIKYFFYDAPGH